MDVVPIAPHFAAEITGVDLRQTLPDEAVREIEKAISQYAVLVFRDQSLTDDEHAAFTKRFGPIEEALLLGKKTKPRLDNDDVLDLANVDRDGNVLAADTPRAISLLANQLWHSDSSFKTPTAKFSILCGIKLPAEGGQTEFADQRAAYDALSPDIKAKVEGLVAEHCTYHSRIMLGGDAYKPTDTMARPTVHWPLVHTVPESGRKSLFIGVHAKDIDGMNTSAARMLLLDLMEHITQRQFVYRHEWRQNDMLMWDNQCVLHRGRPYDTSQLRQIRRCTTAVAPKAEM